MKIAIPLLLATLGIPSLALAQGRFTHSVRTEISAKQGNSTLNERETIVFQRRNGSWIAVHEHLSPQPATS